MFQQAEQRRVFQDVIDQIESAIIEGKLKAGDKLPAERELRKLFNTSRGSLREALRVLEEKGLIEIRTGVSGGAVVRTITTRKMSESLDLLMRFQKVSLEDLAEFREGVEGIVTGLAAERAQEKDIQILKKILKKAEDVVQKGVQHWEEFIHIDNAFHMALAKIAQNPVFESVLQTVHDNINPYYDKFLSRKNEFIKENYIDLCRITQAVEERFPSKARELAYGHVRRFNALMEQSRNGKDW